MVPGTLLCLVLLLSAGQWPPQTRVWLVLLASAGLLMQLLVLPYLILTYRQLDARSWGQVAAWLQGLTHGRGLPIPAAPSAVQQALLELDQSVTAQTQRLTTLAIIDPKSGALNRQGIMRRLRDEIERAQRFNRCVSVLSVRDEDPSDDLVRLLNQYARSVDLVAQTDPDCLLIVMPETTLSGATELARRLQLDVVDRSVGLGVASFPQHASSADQLVRRAESASDSGLHSRDGHIVTADSNASDTPFESTHY